MGRQVGGGPPNSTENSKLLRAPGGGREAEAARAALRVGAKLGEAVPRGVAVRASSCDGEAAASAQEPLLQGHREVAWRHTSEDGAGAAAAGPASAAQ